MDKIDPIEATLDHSLRVRDGTIDVAKAIGITLVVIGHAGPPAQIVNFIYLFHMPLFYFVSGYLFDEASPIEETVIKRLKSLYIPFLKYEFILIILHNWLIEAGIYDPASVSRYGLNDAIRSMIHVVSFNQTELMAFPFWFLGSLFTVSVAFTLIVKLIGVWSTYQLVASAAISAAIAGVGFILASKGVKLPNTLVTSMVCLPFFALGSVYRRYRSQIPLHSVAAIACVAILLLSINHRIDVSIDLYGNPAIFVLNATIGIYMTMIASSLLARWKSQSLSYIGSYTMPIMAFQFLGFYVGRQIAAEYHLDPASMWISASIFGLAVPILISHLLSGLWIDSRTLTRTKDF